MVAYAANHLRIYKGRVFLYRHLETFAKRASVDLEVIFPVNGQMVRVVVPAGCNINNLLDKFGYCGFERLASILGSEVVK